MQRASADSRKGQLTIHSRLDFNFQHLSFQLLKKIACIVTHPIQYQAPLLRLIAASREIDLKVLFLSDFSLHAHYETAFGKTFKWDVNLTDGYQWEVLPRWGIGHSTPMRRWWPVSGVKRRLREGNFDAVWVHGWAHIGLRQAIGAAHALGLPVLLRGEAKPDPRRAVICAVVCATHFAGICSRRPPGFSASAR